jgi:hypothetical protein
VGDHVLDGPALAAAGRGPLLVVEVGELRGEPASLAQQRCGRVGQVAQGHVDPQERPVVQRRQQHEPET